MPARVAESTRAITRPPLTTGAATTTIGPLTKNARPVAVSVKRPGVSRTTGSETVIPETVIGI